MTLVVLIDTYSCTYMFNLILGNELGEVEFSLVVGEEVLALRDCLALQGIAHCLVVFTMLLDH